MFCIQVYIFFNDLMISDNIYFKKTAKFVYRLITVHHGKIVNSQTPWVVIIVFITFTGSHLFRLIRKKPNMDMKQNFRALGFFEKQI